MATYTCKGCKPIDASIIDAYVALIGATENANNSAANAEVATTAANNAASSANNAATQATNAANSATAAAAAANAAGITQADASVDSNTGTPSVDVSLVNKKLSLSFHNIKGEKGDKGDRGDGAVPVINDLVTGGTNAALSAEMGKTLNNTKQATLVSGTNIKTVNGESLLGEGNIIAGDPNAVKYVEQTLTDAQKAQARTNIDSYQKPSTGIPATDLASAAQTSLGKADTAYQKPSAGIPKLDLESGVQASLDLADSAIQARPMGEVDPTITPADYATKEELDELEAKVDEKADQAELSQLQQKVTDIREHGENNYYIMYSGGVYSWYTAGSAMLSRYIKVMPGDVIHIVKNSDRNAYVAFVTSVDTSETPVFANGTSGVMAAVTDQTFQVSEECYFWWMVNYNSSQSYEPSVLTLNGKGILNGIYMVDKIPVIEQELAAIENALVDTREHGDLSKYPGTGNSWEGAEQTIARYIKVLPGDIINVVKNNDRAAYVAFVSSVDTSVPPDFVGDGLKTTVNTETFQVSLECYFVWVVQYNENQIFQPNVLTLNNIDILGGNYEGSKIDTIEQEIGENTKQNLDASLYARANNIQFVSRTTVPYSIDGNVLTFLQECYLIAYNNNNGYIRIAPNTTIDFTALPVGGFMAAYITVPNTFWMNGSSIDIDSSDIHYLTFGGGSALPTNAIVLATCTGAGIQMPVFGSMSFNMLTQKGANYKLVACVLRNINGLWQQIGGSHKSLNVASVSQDGSHIIITYTFVAKNIVSLVVTPDEDFAALGYEIGNSVGLEYTNIYIFNKKPILGTIYYSGGAFHSSNPEIQIGEFADGVLTLTHPTAENSFALVSGDGRGQYVFGAVAVNQTTTQVYIRDYNGNLITSPTNTIQFSIERRRDSIGVQASDADQNGNIWVFGIMEV